MSYTEFDIDVFQNYVDDLARRNKEVKHMAITESCPNGQRCFSRFESEEHISEIKNNGGKKIVVVADVYGQRIGEPDDKRILVTVQLRFAVKKEAATENETNAVNAAVKLAEKIMFQFSNQMEKDFEAGCNDLDGLQADKFSWDKIEEQPWLDDYYGWDLTVTFLHYIPEHSDDDWEEIV